jgi:hypothetical protein
VDRDDEFNEPYLPARYKQKVREKQQRRKVQKILTAAGFIAAIAVVLFLLAGFIGTGPQAPVPPTVIPTTAVTTTPSLTQTSVSPTLLPAVTATSLPDESPASGLSYTIAPGVPVTSSGSSLSLEGAIAALRNYYTEEDYTIRSVNYTAGSTRNLFGFELAPAGRSTTRSVIFIDAATGTPYSPGQEHAGIAEDKARGIALSTFPDISEDTLRLWYYDSPEKGAVWMFILASGNTTLVSGSLDATTGEILAFTRHIPQEGRQAETAITMDKAQNIASHYISEHNGGALPLNQTSARYEGWGTPSVPAAGQYIFSWERLFLDHPVDTDGIDVAVDAVTGDVIGYDKQWSTQDFAFSQSLDQAVARRDATFAVMEAAKNVYPDSVENVRILSAEMRWNNQHPPGSSQRPGSVMLEWKVVFDDATIRADPALSPGIGWVDIQTGNVTGMEYLH